MCANTLVLLSFCFSHWRKNTIRSCKFCAKCHVVLATKKKQRHSEIEGLKYCAVDVFNAFCPFPIQSDRQWLYLHVFADRLLTFTEFFVLLQKHTRNCIVYKRLQHCTFLGNATAALAKETKIRFAIYIKPISANCRNLHNFYASCAFCTKKGRHKPVLNKSNVSMH